MTALILTIAIILILIGFVGWADYNDEKYSIVILLENAGSGGTVAAPMAKKVFSKLILNNDFVSK